MDGASAVLVSLAMGAVALLYASVGHAGASGYLALMALVGVAPASMKPAALALNVLVAAIASVRYLRAGCFDARIFWPLVLASVPCAWVGGGLSPEGAWFRPLLGLALAWCAWQMLASAGRGESVRREAPVPALLLAGAAIGLLSGATGVGGGIFLSPLLLGLGWAATRQVSGVAAAFILLNSLSGLAGVYSAGGRFPPELWWWLPACLAGGWLGARLGALRLGAPTIRRLLALVLSLAAAKMLLL